MSLCAIYRSYGAVCLAKISSELLSRGDRGRAEIVASADELAGQLIEGRSALQMTHQVLFWPRSRADSLERGERQMELLVQEQDWRPRGEAHGLAQRFTGAPRERDVDLRPDPSHRSRDAAAHLTRRSPAQIFVLVNNYGPEPGGNCLGRLGDQVIAPVARQCDRR